MTANASDPIVIAAAARTPMGGFQGELSPVTAPRLGSVAIAAALERAGVKGGEVSEVVMGCVLPAGMGQAPARQASFGAGIPEAVGCTTINKMCGSGMKAAMFGHDLIAAGSADVVVAGGLESMSNAPYLLDKARGGYRLGNGKIYDHMFIDGLEDAYDKGKLMGSFAEDTAEHYQFTREAQDEFAITSLKRAQTATEDGTFSSEITPVTVKTRKGETVVDTDEQPRNANLEKIPTLKDGAAALVMMRMSEAEKRGITPLAIVRGHATHAQAPAWFTTAPIDAVKKVLDRVGWNKDEVGLFEVNEAFAVVTMAAMRDLDIPHEQMNVHGGACALGHPVGASGARIMATLMAAMGKYDVDRGVAALCIGGGEATAVALERVH
jgi:acetyl-CoA C-acetyltransferase